MRRLSGNADKRLFRAIWFNPHRAARAGTVHNPMRRAAQRDHNAVGKAHPLRQAAQARRARASPQEEEADEPVAQQAHDVNRGVKDDFDSLGFAGAAIQHGTLGHNRFIQPFDWADIAISKAVPSAVHKSGFNNEMWYELLLLRTTASVNEMNFAS